MIKGPLIELKRSQFAYEAKKQREDQLEPISFKQQIKDNEHQMHIIDSLK